MPPRFCTGCGAGINPHSVLKGCGTFSARIVTSGTDGFMIGLVEKQESTIQSIPEAQFVHAIRASPNQNYIPFNNGSNQTQTASLQFADDNCTYSTDNYTSSTDLRVRCRTLRNPRSIRLPNHVSAGGCWNHHNSSKLHCMHPSS